MGIKSAGSLIFSPFLLLLVLGLAAHLGVEIVPPRERSRMPARAVWIIAAVMVVTLTGLMIWPPVHAEPWQPPAGIQRFRRIAPLMELEAGVIVLVWAVWSWVRRRRAGLPAGIRMRANLAVASRALLICSVIALVSLGINQRNDRQHQEAFARAAADPLADRLGPDWHAYLTPMYAVLNALK